MPKKHLQDVIISLHTLYKFNNVKLVHIYIYMRTSFTFTFSRVRRQAIKTHNSIAVTMTAEVVYLRHPDSSEPSPQSLSPSHRQIFWIHFLLLHWNSLGSHGRASTADTGMLHWSPFSEVTLIIYPSFTFPLCGPEVLWTL